MNIPDANREYFELMEEGTRRTWDAIRRWGYEDPCEECGGDIGNGECTCLKSWQY